MKGLFSLRRVGIATAAMLMASGCMAAPTTPTASGQLSTDQRTVSPLSSSTARRSLTEVTAAVSAWQAFETGSLGAEHLQVPSTAEPAAGMPPQVGATTVPAAAPLPMPSAAPSLAPALLPEDAGALPLVAAGIGGVENADGTVTVTETLEGTRPEGPYTQTRTLTYQKATRMPVTYRDRLSVVKDGRTLVSESRSKVWLPDGRFTESVSLSGYGADSSKNPWRLDVTTQSGKDGQETAIGTLRRSDGSSLTIKRTRSQGQTTLEVTDTRQGLTLSGSADNSAEVQTLIVLIDGKPDGSIAVAG